MTLFQRLKQDFRLSILTLLCASAIVGITPFAIWRFMQGNWFAGAIDSAILVGLIAAITYALRTGDTVRAGFVLAPLTCGGTVVVATMVGDVGLFWMYPAVLTSFFLTSAGVAFYCVAASLIVLMLHGAAFTSIQQMSAFAATVVVVSTGAYVFARRSERQRDQLEHMANFDSLTGVHNRRAMDQALAAAVRARGDDQTQYGLAVADLDRFKRINDQHGHAVGDSILRKFARLLEMDTRGADEVFRFGGEEFVILFPGADAAAVDSAVGKLQAKVRTSLNSPGGPVTASFGTACLRDSESQKEWVARADDALYRAKQNGRDRIESADVGP